MHGKSIIDIAHLESDHIKDIIELSSLFKKNFATDSIHRLIDVQKAQKKVVYLLFAEPSTRTRVSFETACDRLNVKKVSLSLDYSSVAKGETLEDTFTILKALRPDALIFRAKKLKQTPDELAQSPIPLINAGWGTHSHPTQALCDLKTILEDRGQIEGEKVLIVGDVLHSRVAHSNCELLTRMGAEVAYCSPQSLAPTTELWQGLKNFEDLNEGVKWATVLIALRVHEERHENLSPMGFSMAEYRDKFRIGYDQMNIFNSKGVILHPGPVIRGVEISNYALRDSRCCILKQVENGLYVRLAILTSILNLRS